MSEKATEGYGWGDAIDPKEATQTAQLLPECEAVFSVEKLDRQRKEYGKFGLCNVAVLTLLAQDAAADNGPQVEITVQLPLVASMRWKVLAFAVAIGQRKHGDEGLFTPNWAAMVGRTGMAKVGVREYTDRHGVKRKANEILEFLPPATEAEADNFRF